MRTGWLLLIARSIAFLFNSKQNMNTVKFLFTLILVVAGCLLTTGASAQQKVKDGTVSGSSTLAAPGAALEIESMNKGLLLPRIALSNTTTWGLAGTSAKGMVIYNTKDTMSGFTGTAAYPTAPGDGTGLYFWDGAGWTAAKTSAQDLRLIGNNNHITQDAGVGGNGSSAGLGADNIGIGKNTLASNTTGNENVALGLQSLYSNSTGRYNNALGAYALFFNTTGSSNVAIGREALNKNVSGSQNVGIGSSALYATTTGANNVSVGHGSSFGNTAGTSNTVVGASTFQNNTTGSSNTVIGQGTGIGISTGSFNTIIGASVQGLPGNLNNNIILADGMGNQRIRVLADGKTGINTITPQKQMHINGALQITNELNVGGNADMAGSAGNAGDVLVSAGAGAAPSWKPVSNVAGTIAKIYNQQGTSVASVTVTSGSTGSPLDVPGLSFSHTVPAGTTQTLLFTITGYTVLSSNVNSASLQGAFWLLQDGTKISSAYTSMGDGGNLNNLPHPCTLLKSVTLSGGTSGTTYNFKVQYKAWSGTGDHLVNNNPALSTGGNVDFVGADSGDTETMLTKMQVLVYNN